METKVMVRLGSVIGVAGLFGLYVYLDSKRNAGQKDSPKVKRDNPKPTVQTVETEEKVETVETVENLDTVETVDVPQIVDNSELIQKQFAEHMFLADKYLGSEEFDKGVDELCFSIILSGQIQTFIDSLKEFLPESVMNRIIRRLPFVAKKMNQKLPKEFTDSTE